MNQTAYYFLAILLLLSCGKKSNVPADSAEVENTRIRVTKAQFQQNGMTLGALEERSFPEVISANGMIDVPPGNRATVSAIIGGYIKSTLLLEGDIVEKGQLLVILENPEFIKLQQQYLEVKERLSYLKSEYERQKILLAENISSEKNFLKAESEYNTSMAQHNGLQAQLGLLNIPISEVEQGNLTTTVSLYAPISGSVTQVLVSKGAFVSPASPVLEIIDNSHIHLELSVFERDIMKIEKGQPILFTIPEVSDQGFEAEVYLVGTTIDNKRTVTVHAHLKDDNRRFLTGMFVEAEIIISSHAAPALPNEAIVEVQNAHIALRLISEGASDYLFEKVTLQTGPAYNDYTQINNADAFGEDDEFLLKGAFDLIAE